MRRLLLLAALPFVGMFLRADEAQAQDLCTLDQNYGFYQSGAYTYSSNPNTKWIRATNNLSGANSSWYVITTDGNLRIWVSGTTYGSPIANVGTAVYTNPALLHNAYTGSPCPAVTTTTTTTGGTTTGGTTTSGTTTTTSGTTTTSSGTTTTTGGTTTTTTTTTGGTTTGGTTTGGTTSATTAGSGTTAGGTTGGGTTAGGTTGAVSGPVRATLLPGDPGYVAALNSGTAQIVGYGAYVDLPAKDAAGNLRTYAPGYVPAAGAPIPRFNQVWSTGSNLPTANGSPGVYDSWSADYETLGSDGLDNNGDGIVDEPGEAQTSAPYPGPLPGIQIKIRVYDPSSGSVRELVVRQQ